MSNAVTGRQIRNIVSPVLCNLCFFHTDMKSNWLLFDNKSLLLRYHFQYIIGCWYLHIFYLVSSCSEWWFLTYFSPDARIRIQESWYFLFLVKNGSFNLVNLTKFILFRGIIFNVIIMKMTPLLPILNHKMLFHHFSTDCRQNQIKMLFLHIYCNSV